MSAKIYVCTHKKFDPPTDPMYVPIQVGAEGKEDLGYVPDNTGENISDLNWLFGELTGLYWIWRNDNGTEDIGINHYRRYFRGSNGDLLTPSECEEIMSGCDLIASTLMVGDVSNEEAYGQAHNVKDLHSLGRAVERVFPEYKPFFDEVIHGNESYYGNLCVMKREIFNDYCDWLFTVFTDVMPDIDVSSYDLYRKRIYGFLSEQMMMVYIKKNGLKVHECPVIYTAEKAETEELKAAVSVLLKDKKAHDAEKLINDFIELRPDVLLPLSDITGDLSVTRHILYVSGFEQNHGVEGLLSYSTDLKTLLSHYRKVHEILEKGEARTAEDEAYLTDTKVSEYLIKVMTEDDLYERIHMKKICMN
ncbi:MAG: DUF4422 domain-containing protein [Lachnospiraceae bacterium]|nr:DUF4422 domain-containing protein [Lachnospiraceae bacterium]